MNCVERTEGLSRVNEEQINGLIAAAGVDGTREILQAFWQSTEDLLMALREQVLAGDHENAAKTAHGLKGSSANVGAIDLEDSAREIELLCRAGDVLDVSDVERMVVSFEQARIDFEDHLKRFAH